MAFNLSQTPEAFLPSQCARLENTEQYLGAGKRPRKGAFLRRAQAVQTLCISAGNRH